MRITFIIISITTLIIGCESNYEKTIYEKLDKEAETFLLNNYSDTLIQGREGTLIYIGKESFTNDFGDLIVDSIEIELKEVYDTKDIIAQRISMKSSGEILETGGMINLKAFSNGNQLRLKHGKQIIVHFPRKQNSEEMNLFYGKEDTTQVIEWEIEELSRYRLHTEIIEWYTKYEYLDDSTLYLVDGRNSYDTVYQHFALDERDEEELLNKNVHVNYIVYDNGKLEYQNITGSKISNRLKRKLRKKTKSYPKCKPYTREGDPFDMPGFFAIQSRVIPPSYQSKKDYLKAIEEKFSDGNSKGIELAELQYYIFDSRKLGWMNCDRFINSSPERIEFVVKVPKSKNIFAKVIFENYKTVMTGNEKRGQFSFSGLPLNEPVKVVVIDEKKGKPLLKIEDTVTTREPFKVEGLTEYTIEELKDKLKGLN